jgi:uncharacterized membrane protein
MGLDVNPAIVFLIAMGFSVVLFFAGRLVLHALYDTTLVRWRLFQRFVEKVRKRGVPLMAKYGAIGLVAFVAIPLPGTGVCGATLLSWLLGISWQVSLLAILPGAVIANGIVLLSALGIIQGVNLAG